MTTRIRWGSRQSLLVWLLALTVLLTLAAPAWAAIKTYSRGGCDVTYEVHEHWGKPRVAAWGHSEAACGSMRVQHTYKNGGQVQTTTGGWTVQDSISLTNSGDQCKGRVELNPDATSSGWSSYAYHDSRNCS